MSLGKEDVLHVAKLARVGMTDEEAEKFTTELSGVLEYVETLGEVDTEGVAETAIVTGTDTVLRSDEITCEDKRDALLAVSPKDSRGGQILVDNII